MAGTSITNRLPNLVRNFFVERPLHEFHTFTLAQQRYGII